MTIECYKKDCTKRVNEDKAEYPFCSEDHHDLWSKENYGEVQAKLSDMREEYKNAEPGYKKFLEARAKLLKETLE